MWDVRETGDHTMPLDPAAEALLEQMRLQGTPPFELMSVPEARDAAMAFRELGGDTEVVADVRNVLAAGPAGQLPVRVYHPAPGTRLPLLVYFHGGGWVIGNIEVADKACRALANAAQCVVASVEYRLSPETKFPGPAEDCYFATCWLAERAADLGAKPDQLVVGGDSAGGNLAAAVSIMARDRGVPQISYQLLIYPVTAPAAGTEFASYEQNADGYLLTRAAMHWFWDMYLAKPEDGDNPYASPLKADDLSGLPPAMVVTEEFDPLRDEGLEYARRLREAGVSTTSVHYDGLIHGFFWMGGIFHQVRDLLDQIATELRSSLVK